MQLMFTSEKSTWMYWLTVHGKMYLQKSRKYLPVKKSEHGLINFRMWHLVQMLSSHSLIVWKLQIRQE